MATITLEYDARNAIINKLIDVLIGLGAKASTQPKMKKCGLDESLEDIKAGRVYHAKDVDDMFKKLEMACK
ncbi:MAG: hypothetical protein ACI392_00255 [Paludibacteraceae bacterium]